MRIEARQTIIGAQPQPVVPIRLDAVDDLARYASQAGLILEVHGAGLCRAANDAVEASAGSTHPQLSVVIKVQRVDGIVAETGPVAVVAPIGIETAGFSVEQIQTAPHRPYPKIADCILDDGAGARTAERGGTRPAIGVARDLAVVLIDAGQSAAERAHPQ